MNEDKRKYARRDIGLDVHVRTLDGSRAKAILLDISQSGARVKISNAQVMPDQFLLQLPMQLSRWAQIKWRSGDEAGLAFMNDPHPAGDQATLRVLISCPHTRRKVPTGLCLSTEADLKRVSVVRRFSYCPHCRVLHGWMPNEAFLEQT
jgi:hypothetical protein